MALGRTGSFVTDAPIQRNDVGAAMQQVEDSGFKHRAEEFVRFKAKKDEEAIKEVINRVTVLRDAWAQMLESQKSVWTPVAASDSLSACV